jgi:hypothetical protein
VQKYFQSFFLVLCVILFLGGAFYLGLHGGTSSPRLGRASLQRPVVLNFSEDQVASRLIGNSASKEPIVSTNPTENKEFTTFSRSLKLCTSRVTELSMQEYMEIEIETGAIEKSLQFENLHFHLQNGMERRLQILPAEGDVGSNETAEQYQIRVFGVDSQDLPIPQKISPEISKLPFPRQMHALSEGREPLFMQRRELIKMYHGQTIDVEWINGRVREFQWIGQGFVLSCHQENCICQNGQQSN